MSAADLLRDVPSRIFEEIRLFLPRSVPRRQLEKVVSDKDLEALIEALRAWCAKP
jgi:hypothetical protein